MESPRKIVDARGSFCPGPLMELIAAMKQAAVGDEIEVLSSDQGSASDIPIWIQKVGHEMLDSHEENGVYHIRVRKKK